MDVRSTLAAKVDAARVEAPPLGCLNLGGSTLAASTMAEPAVIAATSMRMRRAHCASGMTTCGSESSLRIAHSSVHSKATCTPRPISRVGLRWPWSAGLRWPPTLELHAISQCAALCHWRYAPGTADLQSWHTDAALCSSRR